MSDRAGGEGAVEQLLESWRDWAAKVLDCGVANVGAHTAGEIRGWAELAETAGWHEDAALARAVVASDRASGERARSFVTSFSRLEIARGLLLRARLRGGARSDH